MTLVICWLVYPLLFALVALGCGLLVAGRAEVALSGLLLIPLGVATMIVVAQVAVSTAATAPLATPAVLVLAIAGLLRFGRRGVRGPVDGWAVAAVLGVFGAYAAPVVLSGQATFTGYIKLDDTATFMGLLGWTMQHGRDLAGLANSSYSEMLGTNLTTGYPVGTLLPLGLVRPLVGQDLAWVYQPYLATLAAFLSLVIYRFVARLFGSRPLRALVAAVAGQSALLYGYALWGGIKELVGALLIALTAALVAVVVRERGSMRSVVPLAVAVAALLDSFGLGAALWVAPLLLAALAAVLYRRGGVSRSAIARQIAAFAGVAALLALPAIPSAVRFQGVSAPLTSATDVLGNLIRPLSGFQVLGIWPSEDFRASPKPGTVTAILLGLAILAAAVGLWLAWRRGAWELVLYLGTSALAALGIAVLGSPWTVAKTLAMSSPAFLAVALSGALLMVRRRTGAVALVAVAAIVGGVLWSNGLQYHDASLAPRAQLSELERLGTLIAGQGPTLSTANDIYADRWFLRAAAPEGAADLRFRPVLLNDGQEPQSKASYDIDAFRLDQVMVYRSLVLRSSPAQSRPPSAYTLRWSGRYYQLWQRAPAYDGRILVHQAFGAHAQAASVPPCSTVDRLAGLAVRAHAHLVAALRPISSVVALSDISYPHTWLRDKTDTNVIYPTQPGTAVADAGVSRAGRYAVWLGGTFGRGVEVSVDGTPAGAARNQLQDSGQYAHIADLELSAGVHLVGLHYPTGDLRPGTSARVWPVGPLVLAPASSPETLAALTATRARALCGRSLDWLEVVSGPA